MYDPYYISVEEDISYNRTTDTWVSTSNSITYACQTDACNRASLLKELPMHGLSLAISDRNWLNTNLLRKANENRTLCRECPEQLICGKTQYAVDMNDCELKNCSSSCLVGELVESTETNPYCYQSLCSDETSPDLDMMSARILIQAVYYLNQEIFEINELNVICNGENCNRLDLFRDIKDKLEKNLRNIQAFLPGNHVNSIYTTSFLSLIVLLFQILVFY